MASILGGLSEKWGRVAVISGRPVSFLIEQLRGAGRTHFHGLYGMEEASATGGVRVRPEAQPWQGPIAEAADEAERLAPPGVAVERKALSFTLHYRAEPSAVDEVERLAARLTAPTGLIAHPGKMSLELRPPLRIDKGTVVDRLAEGLRAVLFAGDDLGDLPAFDVLKKLRGAGVTTVSIASGGDETPAAVVHEADLVVAGPEGVREALRRLV